MTLSWDTAAGKIFSVQLTTPPTRRWQVEGLLKKVPAPPARKTLNLKRHDFAGWSRRIWQNAADLPL
jgi:hypothetical protein